MMMCKGMTLYNITLAKHKKYEGLHSLKQYESNTDVTVVSQWCV